MADSPPAKKTKPGRGLVERLAAGETILCAEGYLMALCRNGYICHGVWVPEFLLEQPEALRSIHYQFIHAGSDVTLAYQYYTHRWRMRMIGREDDLEKINRIALRMAREVAEETGTLFAGGISNTNLFADKDCKDPTKEIRAIFEEQVRWSKEEGVEYMIAETISYFEEAKIALEVIKSFDLPAVIMMVVHGNDKEGKLMTYDGVPLAKALKQLVDMGATLVGVNCLRGLETTLEVVEEIVKEIPPEKVCALPVTFRTTKEEPTLGQLTDKACPKNNPVYPYGLDPFYVSEVEIEDFTKRCLELGLKYIGLCCGNTGNYTRVMAEAMGRQPPASKYRKPELMAKGIEQRKQLKEDGAQYGMKY